METAPESSPSPLPAAENAPAPAPAAPQPRRFGPSERSLLQRRKLLLAVRILALASLATLALSFQPPYWWAGFLKWAVVLGLGWAFWRVKGEGPVAPLVERQLLLHPHALELKRADFRRFVVFASLQHVKLLQGSDERLIALELHTADGSVLLRDMDGLGEVFAAVSAAKPANVLIEVESRPVDWGEPLPWAVVLAVLVLLVALLCWVAPWSRGDYFRNNGRLLLLNGGAFIFWRPASRANRWQEQVPESLLGGLLATFGYFFVS